WGPPGTPPFFSFGLSEWRDVEAAVNWARGQGAERIVMVAESMGGGIAGQCLMHSAEAGAVEALVLDAPAVNTPAIVHSFTRRLPFGGAIEWLGFQLARAVLPVDPEAAVSADAVRDFPGPMFLAHGTADVLVPVDSSRALVAARADARDVYL